MEELFNELRDFLQYNARDYRVVINPWSSHGCFWVDIYDIRKKFEGDKIKEFYGTSMVKQLRLTIDFLKEHKQIS